MSSARTTLLSLVSTLALMVLAICANATTWYVDPNGNDDSNDGRSLAQAFATIQHAIDMASDYDTVLVTATEIDSYGDERSAIYYESIDFKGKKITVDGSGGSPFPFPDLVAEISPPYGGRCVVFHSGETRDSRLRGFLIYGFVDSSTTDLTANVSGSMWDALSATGAYPAGGAIRIVDSSPSIESCFVVGEAQDGLGGAIAATGGSPRIVGCIVTGAAQVGGAIYSQNSSLDIVNCLVSSIFSTTGATYGSAILADGGTVNLVNDTLFDVATNIGPSDPNFALSAAVVSVDGASVLFGNSVYWNDPYFLSGQPDLAPAPSLYAAYGGSMTAKSSDVQGSGGSAGWSLATVTDGGGNIDVNLSNGIVDPAFVDAGDDSLYNAVAADITTDIIGQQRIVGSHIDIGCAEFVPQGNQPPSLNVPSTASVDVGCPVTVQATATDPDNDPLSYALVDSPGWATIDSGTGLITLNPPAGTAGTFTVNVQLSDGNGGTDQKSMTVTVCPLIIEGVKATRKDGKTVIVTFSIRNTSSTVTVTNVSINSATLGGIATRTVLPLLYTSIKPGATKLANVQFTTTQAGTMTFIVNGTSSAGPVCTNKSITVP